MSVSVLFTIANPSGFQPPPLIRGVKFFLPDKGGAPSGRWVCSKQKSANSTNSLNLNFSLQKISLWEIFGSFRIFAWTEHSEVQFENFRNEPRGVFAYFCRWKTKVGRGSGRSARIIRSIKKIPLSFGHLPLKRESRFFVSLHSGWHFPPSFILHS